MQDAGAERASSQLLDMRVAKRIADLQIRVRLITPSTSVQICVSSAPSAALNRVARVIITATPEGLSYLIFGSSNESAQNRKLSSIQLKAQFRACLATVSQVTAWPLPCPSSVIINGEHPLSSWNPVFQHMSADFGEALAWKPSRPVLRSCLGLAEIITVVAR